MLPKSSVRATHEKILNISHHQANTNQNHNEIPLTPVRMIKNNNSDNNRCWRGCGGRGTFCTAGESANWCSHAGKQYGCSSKN